MSTQVPTETCSQEVPVQNSKNVTRIIESSSVESCVPPEVSLQEVTVQDLQDVSNSLVSMSSQEVTVQSLQDETNSFANTHTYREIGSQEVTIRSDLCLPDVTSPTQGQFIPDRQMETNYNSSNASEQDLNKVRTSVTVSINLLTLPPNNEDMGNNASEDICLQEVIQNTEILQDVTNTEISVNPELPADKLEINSESLDITDHKETTSPVGETVSSLNKNHYDSDTISTGSADHVDNTDQCSENSDIAASSSESVLSVSKTRALRAKEHLSSIGLSDEFYDVNLSTYYPLVSQDDDLDFINFADIVNNSCCVSLDNLSAEGCQI